MGKFSGILLCTDFDNSFVYRLQMTQKNIDTIKYFKENGGLFTVITGRSQDVLRRIEAEAQPNTYLGLCNGTVVYDPFTDTVVTDDKLSDLCLEQLLEFRRRYDGFKLFVCAKEGVVVIDSDDEVFAKKLSDCKDMHIRKHYLYRHEHFEDDVYKYACELFGTDFEVTRSSIQGIEVQNSGVNKGNAALKIKELTGARLLVCVGDYENDISMIKAADIGYAVGNACEPLKAVADRITVDCKDDAIAAVIEELESEL